MKHAPSIAETIRLCDERAATYGAMRAIALTAVVLDLAIETLRHYEGPVPQRAEDAWLELEAFARLIERPPLDDVLLKQDAAFRLAAAIRTLSAGRDQ